MKVTLKVEGMMCPHCEARVKAAIEAVAGVSELAVSHKEGTASFLAASADAVAAAIDASVKAGYPAKEE